MTRRELLGLYLLALTWHLGWAVVTPGPFDWDVSYYLGVGQRIVAHPFEPVTTDAVWNLGWLPATLEHPADLHWMPLPSRVLVPAIALAHATGADPWRASQAFTAAIAALVGVMSAIFAQRLGASRGLMWTASLIAGSGLGYVRYLSVPDSIAIYAASAGCAWLMLAGSGTDPLSSPRLRTRQLLLALACVAAALSRSEGALVGACVALGGLAQRDKSIVAAGLAGPAATMLWAGRCQLLIGDGYSALRTQVFNATQAEDWLLVSAPEALSATARLGILADHTLDVLKTPFAAGALLLPVALLVTMFSPKPHAGGRGGESGEARATALALLAYAVAAPLTLYLVAPSVAIEGSVFRSGSALLAPTVAYTVVGLSRLSPRFHPLFFPGLYAVAQGAVVTLIGLSTRQFSPPFPDCAALDAAGVPPNAPIFSYDPIGTSTRCRHPGIVLGRASTPADIDALALRYGIEWALTAPSAYHSWTYTAETFDLPGWTRMAPLPGESANGADTEARVYRGPPR